MEEAGEDQAGEGGDGEEEAGAAGDGAEDGQEDGGDAAADGASTERCCCRCSSTSTLPAWHSQAKLI